MGIPRFTDGRFKDAKEVASIDYRGLIHNQTLFNKSKNKLTLVQLYFLIPSLPFLYLPVNVRKLN